METTKQQIEKALYSIIKYDDHRYWMQRPFTIENNVYSTDACIIIQVPKDSVGFFNKCEKESSMKIILNYFDFTPEKIMTINMQDLKDAISEIPLVDEILNEDIEGKCEECYGTGEVEWEYEGYHNDFDCPVCDGNGTIPELKKEKTGRKIKAPNYFIDINFNRIKSYLIEELINIATSLNTKKIEVIHQISSNKPICFQVGIAKIIMMPVNQTNEQKIIHRFESFSKNNL